MTWDYAQPTWAHADSPEPPKGDRRRTVLIGAGAAAGAALVIYVAAAWVLTSKVADGTTVSGLAIGGLDRSQAEAKINTAFTSLDGRLPVGTGGQEAELELGRAGLAVDAKSTVEDLAGFTLSPVTMWRHVGGGHAVEAGSVSSTLPKALTELAATTDKKPADAGISFKNGEAVLKDAVTGEALQVAPAATVVNANWLAGKRVDLPTAATQPAVTQEKGEAALEQVAAPAVSGPLKLKVGDDTFEVSAKNLSGSLSMTPANGELKLGVDGKKLRHSVLEANPSIGVEPKDAQIVLRGGKPAIIPGVAGTTIDDKDLGTVVLPALGSPERTAAVKTKLDQPDLTTDEARKLGVKSRISTFSTNLTSNADRTENLRIAARTVNGTLVLPGETFSLNQVLGQRTPAKGYNMAPTIQGGRLVPDYGGGVSQMATTIFNNVFFAGLQDVAHKPHSFYISRYPEGREATVNYPTVDLKWRNDSKYGVLVAASVGPRVTVSFWSTKTWDITAGKSARSNVKPPKTIYDESDDCVVQDPSDGFNVSVTRTFRRPGSSAVVRTQTFRSTYIPEDHVICGPKP